jgi:hypothetical protein
MQAFSQENLRRQREFFKIVFPAACTPEKHFSRSARRACEARSGVHLLKNRSGILPLLFLNCF